jgi:phospholipase/carboxylesterase
MTLTYLERPAATVSPAGLLILHHGRGTDERDLFGLADVIDPERRHHVASVRGPLTISGSPGYHWYLVPRVGHPDPDSFRAARAALAETHDELWDKTGLGAESTVLCGFSMGTAMSYAMALGGDRPAVGGVLAFSGFVPTVEGWQAQLEDRTGTRVFIGHGTADPVIGIEFAHAARDLLTAGGLEVEFRESGVGHTIDPTTLSAAVAWFERL